MFRLPLRNAVTAAESQVCHIARAPEEVEALVDSFAAAARQMLLFTRHVREITVLVIEPGATQADVRASLEVVPLQPAEVESEPERVPPTGEHGGTVKRTN